MSEANSSHTECSSRACLSPAADRSPISGLQLCQLHLERDLAKLLQRKDAVLKMLCSIGNSSCRTQLRLEQSALAAELEEVNDTFDSLLDMVNQWKHRIVSRVQLAHDAVVERLRDVAEAEQCEKDLTKAHEAGDMRQMMELTASVELWLEDAKLRQSEFEEARSKLHRRQSWVRRGLSDDVIVRSVGDVSAGIQQLNFLINRHMEDVMIRCWLDDKEPRCSTDSSLACVPEVSMTIDELESGPCHVTASCNTAGFGYDSSGVVAMLQPSSSELTPLPEPCLFVSFKEKRADHLLVTSLDGAVRLKYRTELDWNEWISGLHCDDKRQFLFVAQLHALTVTNLCGFVQRVITAETLHQSALRITAISGNSDKVFVLNRSLKTVLSISKDTGKLESAIDVANYETGGLDELSLHGYKLLLLNYKNGLIHKLCSISGQLLDVYPDSKCGLELKYPGQSVVDSRGLLYVTDNFGRLVRVFSSCTGAQIQTLNVTDVETSESVHRFGLAVVEDDISTISCLVVANERDNCLVLFSLNK